MSNTPKLGIPHLAQTGERLRDDLNNVNLCIAVRLQRNRANPSFMEFKNAEKRRSGDTLISMPTQRISFSGTMILKSIRSVIYVLTQPLAFFLL
jgi:hypothetical protein